MQHGEKFNTITHLLGAIAAAPGLVYLIVLAAATGDAWKVVSVTIYGATLLLLYSFSTLYHELLFSLWQEKSNQNVCEPKRVRTKTCAN